jgi:hypothetical protein
MNKIVRASLLAASLAGLGTLATTASGCGAVVGSQPSSTAVTGEAWYIEATGFFGWFWASRVFYCPAATGPGPSTCTEAKMVPLTPAQIEAQKPPK